MGEEQDKEVRISAGEQLRHLREQKNMSVKDIANRLNLEAKVIEAIEDNDFESLPAATYVRGYLRSYAKTLDADPEAIIASYNPEAAEAPEIIPEVKHTSQTSSSDKPVQAFTYLISLTLVILLIAWWQSTNMMGPGSGRSSEVDDAPPGLGYEIPIVEHSTLPFYKAPEPEAIEQSESIFKAEADTIEENALAESTEPDMFVTTDSQGPDSIVLTVNADSWVEIFDATDSKVFVNLAREGQTLTLRGTAPFSVVLGFAEGIKVEFNGQSFDSSPYTKGSIARFSLANE